MKCARCGHDSTFPQRSGRVCPGCKGRFAFEPREGDPLTDMAWRSALEQVSSNGTVRFTRQNLRHAVARRIKRTPARDVFLALACVALVVGMVGSLVSGALWGVAVGAVLLALSVRALRRPRAPSLDEREFERLLDRWVEAHGAPAKLIAPRVAPMRLAPPMAAELEHYSFDRAVVCDRRDTVDLLLGNDFHFENNCAVLTADGYPEHAAPTLRAMLRKNPRLEVFALHDATPEGCTLAHRLANDPEWFHGAGVRVYDVAMRPAQAARTPTLVLPASVDVAPHPALTDFERTWLSRHRMELAALTPEQLVKRLYRAITRMPELAATADAATASDTAVVLWSTDAQASDGGGDSFG